MSDEERLCITENTLQDCMDKISELKEQYKRNSNIIDATIIKQLNHTNVLRELSLIQKDFLDYIKADYTDGIPIYERFIERITKILEKLK